jgi:nucleoside permease NupC
MVAQYADMHLGFSTIAGSVLSAYIALGALRYILLRSRLTA